MDVVSPTEMYAGWGQALTRQNSADEDGRRAAEDYDIYAVRVKQDATDDWPELLQ